MSFKRVLTELRCFVTDQRRRQHETLVENLQADRKADLAHLDEFQRDCDSLLAEICNPPPQLGLQSLACPMNYRDIRPQFDSILTFAPVPAPVPASTPSDMDAEEQQHRDPPEISASEVPPPAVDDESRQLFDDDANNNINININTNNNDNNNADDGTDDNECVENIANTVNDDDDDDDGHVKPAKDNDDQRPDNYNEDSDEGEIEKVVAEKEDIIKADVRSQHPLGKRDSDAQMTPVEESCDRTTPVKTTKVGFLAFKQYTFDDDDDEELDEDYEPGESVDYSSEDSDDYSCVSGEQAEPNSEDTAQPCNEVEEEEEEEDGDIAKVGVSKAPDNPMELSEPSNDLLETEIPEHAIHDVDLISPSPVKKYHDTSAVDNDDEEEDEKEDEEGEKDNGTVNDMERSNSTTREDSKNLVTHHAEEAQTDEEDDEEEDPEFEQDHSEEEEEEEEAGEVEEEEEEGLDTFAIGADGKLSASAIQNLARLATGFAVSQKKATSILKTPTVPKDGTPMIEKKPVSFSKQVTKSSSMRAKSFTSSRLSSLARTPGACPPLQSRAERAVGPTEAESMLSGLLSRTPRLNNDNNFADASETVTPAKSAEQVGVVPPTKIAGYEGAESASPTKFVEQEVSVTPEKLVEEAISITTNKILKHAQPVTPRKIHERADSISPTKSPDQAESVTPSKTLEQAPVQYDSPAVQSKPAIPEDKPVATKSTVLEPEPEPGPEPELEASKLWPDNAFLGELSTSKSKIETPTSRPPGTKRVAEVIENDESSDEDIIRIVRSKIPKRPVQEASHQELSALGLKDEPSRLKSFAKLRRDDDDASDEDQTKKVRTQIPKRSAEQAFRKELMAKQKPGLSERSLKTELQRSRSGIPENYTMSEARRRIDNIRSARKMRQNESEMRLKQIQSENEPDTKKEPTTKRSIENDEDNQEEEIPSIPSIHNLMKRDSNEHKSKKVKTDVPPIPSVSNLLKSDASTNRPAAPSNLMTSVPKNNTAASDNEGGGTGLMNLMSSVTSFLPSGILGFGNTVDNKDEEEEEDPAAVAEAAARRQREDAERREAEILARREAMRHQKQREAEEKQKRAEMKRRQLAKHERAKEEERRLKDEQRRRKRLEEEEERRKKKIEDDRKKEERRKNVLTLKRKMEQEKELELKRQRKERQQQVTASTKPGGGGPSSLMSPPAAQQANRVGAHALRTPTGTRKPKESVGPASYMMTPANETVLEASDDEKERRRGKRVPRWARPDKVMKQLEGPMPDPDNLFASSSGVNLHDVFGNQRRFRTRSSSGNWLPDRVTAQEELAYKKVTRGFNEE